MRKLKKQMGYSIISPKLISITAIGLKPDNKLYVKAIYR